MNVLCPSCSRELLLPPDVAGKMVKCPACQMVFPADGPGTSTTGDGITPRRQPPPPPEPDPLPPPLPPLADVKRARPIHDEDLIDSPRLRRRLSKRYDDVEDRPRPRGRRGYNYDDDDDFIVRRHPYEMKEAEDKVAAPAICLMCYGGLYMLVGLGLAIGGTQVRHSDERVVMLAFAMIIVVQAGFIILGAIMMKTMRSWGFALAAGILPLITHPCNIVGIGLGVWAIDAVNKRYVKRAFRRKAEGDDYDED